jgi:hypothetical protein
MTPRPARHEPRGVAVDDQARAAYRILTEPAANGVAR